MNFKKEDAELLLAYYKEQEVLFKQLAFLAEEVIDLHNKLSDADSENFNLHEELNKRPKTRPDDRCDGSMSDNTPCGRVFDHSGACMP